MDDPQESTKQLVLAIVIAVLGCVYIVLLEGCSPTQIPVAAPVAPVNVHCDVNVTALDGGTISFGFDQPGSSGEGSVGARWLDHYCGSDPRQSVGQEVESTVSPDVNISPSVAATGQGTASVPPPATTPTVTP